MMEIMNYQENKNVLITETGKKFVLKQFSFPNQRLLIAIAEMLK